MHGAVTETKRGVRERDLGREWLVRDKQQRDAKLALAMLLGEDKLRSEAESHEREKTRLVKFES